MGSKHEEIAKLRAELARRQARLSEESRMPGGQPGPARQAPLSFAQQRLWFLDQLEPGSALYNISMAVRLTGILDVDAVQAALNVIVQRHAVLRTTFVVRGDQPVQSIAPALALEIPLVDWSERDFGADGECEAAVRRFILDAARRPFDLQQGPLLRVHLLRLSLADHVLLFDVHHTVFDGWSTDVLIREFATLYAHRVKGESLTLPDLPIQYAEFAAWQREWLQGAVLERQLAYWKEKLGRGSPPLALPTDYPYPSFHTFAGDRCRGFLPGALVDALGALSRQENVTLFMTLLAAFKVLLYRYTGQEDISVGSPIANRTRREIEGLIGFFVNTLVLRDDLSGNPTFRELLARVQTTTLDAYAHQDLPFEMLVEALQPTRDMSRNPLFQVMFALQNASEGVLELPGLTLTPLDTSGGMAKFDIVVLARQTAEGIRLNVEYNTDLFAPATMTRFLAHWQTLLEAIVADPDRPIGALALLGPAERRQVLTVWNATQGEPPVDACFYHCFAAQVARAPDAVAVVAGNERLTYAELDRRADSLARRLQSLGVGPETFVAVCLDQGIALLESLLGILKAGGAYVPLDIAYPQERLAFILADTQTPVVLTQRAYADKLPPVQGRVICVDDDEVDAGPENDRPFLDVVLPGNVAYVIYTSGSTGMPKGVMCTHRNMVNYLIWVNTVFDVDVPAITKPTFDASLRQIFTPLLRGRTVWFLPEATMEVQLDTLLSALSDRAETGFGCVPSLWKAILALIGPDSSIRLDNLTHLFLGGEAISQALLSQTLEQLPHVQVWNMYGPTEITVSAAYARLAAGDRVTIGRPAANAKLYILDAHMEPVPVGVTGELYVGGVGVARGYLNRPGVTAERFVPHPFSAVPGDRLYRTGDMVRYLSNGNVEFLGRSDDQVKVRGFRIELGEIAAALHQHPDVKDAVVLVRGLGAGDDQANEKQIVAYVVAEDAPLVAGDLQRFLQSKLPDYMIPSAYAILEALPLFPNGKVNRRALLDMEPVRSARTVTYVAPRTPTESALVKIWETLLGAERIGVHDNFFDLGGHSLLATQVISRIIAAFRVQLSVRKIFEAPTIAQLAQCIAAGGAATAVAKAVTIPRRTATGPAALSFAQQRLWFFDQLQPSSAMYNLPMAVRLAGTLDVGALQTALNAIVQRHAVLRTTFVARNDRPMQHVAPTFEPEISLVDWAELEAAPDAGNGNDGREAAIRRFILDAARRPFDLAHGPVLRVHLLRVTPSEHILVLNIHHIAFDGWSVEVLLREFAALYTHHVSGTEAVLPELPVQYADFSEWQRQWMRSEAMQAQLAYWKRQLSDVPEVLELPLDYARPPVKTYAGASQSFELAPELCDALKELSRQEGATLFMTLLAAFYELLHRYSGQTDLLVGTPIANRTHTEIEHLIGFFVNTLVLRVNLSDDPPFRTLLQRVREVTLDAHAHQDIPFERLVEELHPQRRLSHTPLFQVMFAFINAETRALDLPELQLEVLETDSGAARLDLGFALRQTAQTVTGTLTYDTDLFAPATIRRFVKHWQTLLESIVACPDARIGTLALFDAAEREQVLNLWNATATDFPADMGFHPWFAAQVARTPDAVAVVSGEEPITYAALERRVAHLAGLLQGWGVGPETRVAVCQNLGVDLLVSLLGILKAGGVYVPLDPAYPQERLAFVLTDAQVRVVLVRGEDADRLPATQARIVCVDDDRVRSIPESAPVLVDLVTPDNAAYVIYTSGSTGQPKGVVCTHRNLVNYLHWAAPVFCVDLPAIIKPTFDASLTLLLAPLVAGRPVWFLPVSETQPDELLRMLTSRNPVGLCGVPSLWKAVFNQIGDAPARFDHLTHLFLGGESISPALLAQTLARLPHLQIWNCYGPTEASVGATAVQLAAGGPRVIGPITIGRPISNVALYILDAHGQPAPIGVAGELYIGGAGVARGYLGRPGLTAERFIPDPFGAIPGARLYRSGDLARYHADGKVEFLGRADDQVKIRGYRIELGEITAALQSHPDVKDAIVLLRGASADAGPAVEKRIAAYVVADAAKLTVDALQQFVSGKLPDYMAPAMYIILNAFPLSSNGKVDRQALLELAPARSESAVYVAPRTPLESALVEIWETLLGVARVGVHDDFFALGGHSLLATQAVAHIARVFEVQISVRAFFEMPTVAQIAQRIEAAGGGDAAAPIRFEEGEL